MTQIYLFNLLRNTFFGSKISKEVKIVVIKKLMRSTKRNKMFMRERERGINVEQ